MKKKNMEKIHWCTSPYNTSVAWLLHHPRFDGNDDKQLNHNQNTKNNYLRMHGLDDNFKIE